MRFKHGLLFANDRARQVRKQLGKAVELLEATGMRLTQVQCKPRQMHHMIAEHRHHIDLVIVAGGDGTLNRAIEAIVDSGLPFAILPLGTANDLARTLAIPFTVEGACKVIEEGHTRSIDLGWVNGKPFFNVASLGLSVAITQQLSRDLKRRFGALAYCMAALRVLWRFRPFHAEIHLEGKIIAVKTVQIAVGNGRFYGGGMQIAHDATIDDQLLHLYSIEVTHWWELFPLLKALRTGHQAEQQQIRTLSGRELKIYTRRSRHLNTDGEITTTTPAAFKVLPRAVQVCTPAHPPEEASIS